MEDSIGSFLPYIIYKMQYTPSITSTGMRMRGVTPSQRVASSTSGNNTFLGWLETLESARVARVTRSSFKISEKNL